MKWVPLYRSFLERHSTWHSVALSVVGVLILNALPVESLSSNYGLIILMLLLLIGRLLTEPERWRSTQWLLAGVIFGGHLVAQGLTVEGLVLILSIWAMLSGVVGLIWSDRFG